MFGNFSIPNVLISYVALIFSLSVHEASHAGAAYLLDDDTAARMGRLTLNPLAHIDLIGTVLLPLSGLIFGGFFIGWAKPVPFDPRYLTRRLRVKVSSALISVAGPVSNLVLAFIFLMVIATAIRFMGPVQHPGFPGIPVPTFTLLMASIKMGPETLIAMDLGPGLVLLLGLGGKLVQLNILLAIFNLLPLGPLDGAGVLGGFIPDRYTFQYNRLRYHPATLGILIVLMVVGVLGPILLPLMNLVFSLYLPFAHLVLGA